MLIRTIAAFRINIESSSPLNPAFRLAEFSQYTAPIETEISEEAETCRNADLVDIKSSYPIKYPEF